MIFERTRDMKLVRDVMTHPRIWPWITDDGTGPADQFTPPDLPSVWYVAVRDGNDFMGIWMFVPRNAICYEVHTCLLPKAWGSFAVEASRAMSRWMWENSPARRIVTAVPAYNRLALNLARNAGMTQYGTDPQSCLKGGKVWDVHLLGISKEAPCQQQ